jgi:hypothetical protein
MAIITLNLGRTSQQPPDNLDPNVRSDDTLKIIFHQSGTFYSQDADNFDPPLPNGKSFQQGEMWPPDSDGAKPKVKTKYNFQAGPVPTQQGTGVLASGGGPVTFNVIHIP